MILSPPRNFSLRPEQSAMVDMMHSHDRCAVWAGMGTGKTSATLSALRDQQLVNARPALVLAPLRVAMSTWPDEQKKWSEFSGLTVECIHGTAAERLAALQKIMRGGVAVATINYENLPWLVETLGERWPFGTVIADEATRLRGFRLRQGSRRAAALAKVAFRSVDRLVELTGTPAPNGYAGLWGQVWFLDRGARLGSTFTAFRDRWFSMGYDGHTWSLQRHAKAEIDRKLADICQTIETTHTLDAPIENKIFVEMPAKARAIYENMATEMFAVLASGHEIEAPTAAARTNKCRQIANGFLYTDENRAWQDLHDAKLQALESVIEEANGMPVLVAYSYKADLARLTKAFPRGRALDKNPQTIRDWNAGAIPVLFAHPASAGHGLNLQDGGNILVFFGVDWNLEEHQQIIERIGPQRQKQAGHNRPVYVHYILAADTLDEDILWRLANKASVQESLLRAMSRRKTV